MKAVAVYPASKEIRLIDHPEPELQAPSDVMLRMLEVGICGTDKEICSFEYGTPPSGSDHLVLGHESLGEVVAVGSAVTRLKAGDLVVPMVRRPCPHNYCHACRAGRQDFCFTGDFKERGIKELHGYMTERIVDDERYMNVVPRELREVGVLVEPLTIAEKALAQVWDIQERLPWNGPSDFEEKMGKRAYHRALVLGAGPVGMLGAMAVTLAGFETFVYSQEPTGGVKSQLVESIGAHYISAAATPVDDLPKAIGNIDLVYEAVGASSLAFETMKHLSTNGIFCFTGVPGRKGPIAVDTDLIMRNLVLKNQVFFGTVNAGRETFEAAIRDLRIFLKRWPESVRALITGRFPIDRHRDLLIGKPGGIKNIIVL